MSRTTETSRTGATKPKATEHLPPRKKQALDRQAEAEHTDGKKREELTKEMEKLGREGNS